MLYRSRFSFVQYAYKNDHVCVYVSVYMYVGSVYMFQRMYEGTFVCALC